MRRAVFLILFTLLIAQPALAADPVGSITRIQDRVSVNGQRASLKTPIHSGDVIATDVMGRVEVTFKDATILTVGGDSWFTIDSYSYSSDAPTGEALLTLAKGAFRMVTSTIIDEHPENLKITTPLASIGIRGTDFWGGFLSADALDVVMLDGKGVEVTTKAGPLLIDKPGYGLTVSDSSRLPHSLKQWGAEKLGRATATVTFQ